MYSADLGSYLIRITKALEKTDVGKALEALRATSDSGGTIWLVGNGGSAATASHFATDLNKCKDSQGRPISAMSLCDNTGLITAIGNDFSFEEIFLRQLINLSKPGDLLIVLSASGNSKNLITAIQWAKSNRVLTLSMTGFDGGLAIGMTDISLHVPTQLGDYGVAEDAHSILCHFLSSQFR